MKKNKKQINFFTTHPCPLQGNESCLPGRQSRLSGFDSRFAAQGRGMLVGEGGFAPLLMTPQKIKTVNFFNYLKKTDFLVFFALCLLYFKYIPVWTKEWFDFDSFYSFFPFLVIFGIRFFRIKAEELKNAGKKPVNQGLLILILGAFVYFVGVKADMDLFIALSLPLIFSGTVLYLYGASVFRIVLPVIILFSISLPVLPIFRITVPLQIFLAAIAAKILHLLSINAHAVGSNIYIDKYLITVEAGCTGVKSLSSLLVINFLLFYFKYISVFKKLLIALFSLLLAFTGNITRILLINFYIIYNGIVGLESFHYAAGFVLFVISLLIILVLNEFIEEDKFAEAS